jgi:hypothetical protein
MARFITESQFEVEAELVPARYAKDASIGILFGSGLTAFLAMLCFILDGWETSVYMLHLALWMELFYLCVVKK